jgi:opacity protein-like surface antigen
MKMVFRFGLVLLIGLIFCSQSAFAEASWTQYYWPNGIYIGGGGAFGYTFFRMNPYGMGGTPVLIKGKGKTGASGFSLRVGYVPKAMPFHADIIFSYLGKFHYNSTQVFFTPIITYNNMTSDLSSQFYFVNVYYDMPLYKKFWPYIGVGIGQARNKTSLTATNAAGNALRVDYTKRNLALQATIGFNVKVMKNVLLYADYHFMDLGKAQWGPWGTGANRATLRSSELFVHAGEVGIKIFFGDQTPYQPPLLINDIT